MNKIQEIREALAASTGGIWVRNSGPFGDNGILSGDGSPVVSTSGEEYATVVINPEDEQLLLNAGLYVSYLLQLVETQAQALEFYADEDNYDTGVAYPDGSRDDAPIDVDCGERAREALGTL